MLPQLHCIYILQPDHFLNKQRLDFAKHSHLLRAQRLASPAARVRVNHLRQKSSLKARVTADYTRAIRVELTPLLGGLALRG